MFDLGGSDEIVLSSDALKSLQVKYLEDSYARVDAKGNRLESRNFLCSGASHRSPRASEHEWA